VSDFWWGVLALPLIAVAVSAAACIVFGTWLVVEHWAEGRTRELNYDPDDHGDPFHRRTPAAVVLVAPKLRRFRLGWGCSLLYVRGVNSVPIDRFRAAENAVTDALEHLR
jgi:hypothetical protein